MVPPVGNTAEVKDFEFVTDAAASYNVMSLPAVEATALNEQASRRVAIRERDAVSRRALAISDLLMASVAAAATIALSRASSDWADFIAISLAVPVCYILGLYDRDADLLKKTTLDEMPRLLCAAMIVAVTAFVARNAILTHTHGVATDELTVLAITLFFGLSAGRVETRRILRRGTPPERVLLIGSDQDRRRLRNALAATPSLSAEIVGHRSSGSGTDSGSTAASFSIDELMNELSLLRVDRVVIGSGARKPTEFAELIRMISESGVKVSLQPALFGSTRLVPLIEEIGAVKLFSLRQPRLSPTSMKVKRVIDFAAAAFTLILLSPLMLAIMIALKLDSRGPVFYRQRRIGRDSEPFEIIKFRTMRVGAEREKQNLLHLNETDGLFKLSDDPRITRVGKFLRKTSLDELPQLINVVKGDMSLVGPRPLVPEEDQMISGWARHRSSITPGMTGVWQLLGPVRIPLDEMVELDYEYVNSWSLGTDLRILLQTIPHVLGRHGL